MDFYKVRIESEHLFQLPITEGDAEEIFAHFTSEITTYMLPRAPIVIEETYEFIRESRKGIANGSNLQLVIRNKETAEFIGCSGLHKIGSAHPELGIWIKKEAHGHHYGREAVTAVIAWAKSQIQISFQHLIYPVDRRNIPSRAIAETNGGYLIEEKKVLNLSGNELDEVVYRIDFGNC